jgi:hypothetical protein
VCRTLALDKNFNEASFKMSIAEITSSGDNGTPAPSLTRIANKPTLRQAIRAYSENETPETRNPPL